MNEWFARDETHRRLTEEEQRFVGVLSQALEILRPAQVHPEETALTAEASDCLICLIPHKCLGGISVVVNLTVNGTDVSWAQVGGLGRSHDSLDMGVIVATFQPEDVRRSSADVVERVLQELNRPLILHLDAEGSGAAVHIRDNKGKLSEVGSLGTRGGHTFLSLFRKSPAPVVVEVRFTDRDPPPVKEPSGAFEWFRSGSS